MPTMRRAVLTAKSQSLRCSPMRSPCYCSDASDLDARDLWSAQRPAKSNQSIDCHNHHNRDEETRERCVDIVVEDDPSHLIQGLRRSQDLSSRKRLFKPLRVREEADRRCGAEHLLKTRGQCANQQPDRGNNRHPSIALALHLEQDHGADNERYPRQHLVRNAKQWPQGVYPPHWVDDTLIKEIAS